MVKCKNCGREIDGQVSTCPYCGTPVAKDKGGILWGLLGCFFPLVGLILFVTWRYTKPKTAKAAGIGALIGVVLIIVRVIAQSGLLL